MAFYSNGYCRSSTGMIHKYEGSFTRLKTGVDYFQTACGRSIIKRGYNVGPVQTATACKGCKVNLDLVFPPKSWAYDLSGLPLYDE